VDEGRRDDDAAAKVFGEEEGIFHESVVLGPPAHEDGKART
jgi:hypothetical protein